VGSKSSNIITSLEVKVAFFTGQSGKKIDKRIKTTISSGKTTISNCKYFNADFSPGNFAAV